MIQLLASKYNKHIAYCFFIMLWIGFIPANAKAAPHILVTRAEVPGVRSFASSKEAARIIALPSTGETVHPSDQRSEDKDSAFIDGPSQPEMSSFKAAGTNDMVNLFTGDFSYNIPLLDVGGYPVNIFYSGGITPEQEASWVGLGWNINPGNVNRNMRGVPDDFNGEDTLKQYQAMKPNKTWGFRFGSDLEIFGSKFININLGLDLGASFNNYLGPSVEFGVKGNLNASIALKTLSDHNASSELIPKLGVGLGVGGNLNTRYGLTGSANASLSARFSRQAHTISAGMGLSTSVNSRTGIKALQIYEQVGYNKEMVKNIGGKDRDYSGGRSFQLSSSISFVRPSYLPVMRAVNTNSSFAGHVQFGSAFWGVFKSIETEVYFQKSTIEKGDTLRRSPMVGYMYYQQGFNDKNAVMDLSRFNDREVTPATSIVSVPQYAYDVFSIQGEGTGGSVRAYRNDLGYVRDNETGSRDNNKSFGVDVGVPSHAGGNYNTINTPTSIGEWKYGNKLRTAIPFRGNGGLAEAVYFRSPGESSVIEANQYEKIGGADPVRYKLGGSNANPTIEPALQRIGGNGRVLGEVSVLNAFPAERKKRTQVISFLTAAEASYGGLDKMLKSYNPDTLLDANKFLKADVFHRVSEYRKGHHISQVNVTETDGKRYVYGIPVYNVLQKDFSFTVAGNDPEPDFVSYQYKDSRTGSDHLAENASKDGYVQVTETPAYAHSFLLSGLLSPDYVDVTGDGITEDDMGTAIKFNYTRIKQSGDWAVHKWRTPLAGAGQANLNAGNRTETKDDKGIVSYGERESWYLHSIESKTMVAVFRTGNRAYDGKGAISEFGGVNASDNSLKRLDRIDLYNKADLKKNGISVARPIKSVHFAYSYRLCRGTSDNPSGASAGADSSGKLTLEKIWFTYNGQTRSNKDQYLFSYGNTSQENPAYEIGASDRWGNYKPASANPAGSNLKNREYPYSKQDKELNGQFAAAWSLRKILLPSGGQIEVEYEGDDYAYVQNKRAGQMMQVVGVGTTSGSYTSALYDVGGDKCDIIEKDYVFIKVPEACDTKEQVMAKYLQGQTQLSFKLAVYMPRGGVEYIPCYAFFKDYGYLEADHNIIWVKVERLDGLNPLSLSAVEYLREQLPGQAFKGYDLSEGDLVDAAAVLLDMLTTIGKQMKSPVKMLRCEGKARNLEVTKSFVRLNVPAGYKYGGGHRVRSVKLLDNWQAMQGKFNSTYGQNYNYETTEVFNGQTRVISSGVASYEPALGGEENPFQSILQVANQLPMGPTSYGAIEMPVLDAFFPAPLVGYSKITVTSLKKNIPEGKKSHSGIGRQVTEYFTAKDYPVQYTHTSFDESSDKQLHKASRGSFLSKSEFDSRAVSQGFLVVTNDMHGQMKSQSSYAENDTLTRINYTRNYYRNTGEKGLDEKFDFVHASLGGQVKPGNMGIDIELMTDTREFSVKSTSVEDQGQVDLLYLTAVTIPIITLYPVEGYMENIYRAVTTTKTVTYHAVLDSVVVIDKGSTVSTKNLVYDAETGSVVVNRTNNEFDKPVYTVNYPAYWAYSGMGLAYKNIDAVYENVNFLDGRIVGGNVPDAVFESGDELLLTTTGSAPEGCALKLVSGDSVRVLWAFDRMRNRHSLASSIRDIIFLDKKGQVYTRSNVSFRIVRSGRRNMLAAPLSGITMMDNPVKESSGIYKLTINNQSKVINASAVDYNEKWQGDADMFPKLRRELDPLTCGIWEVEDCNGYLEKSINPYVKGLLGNFRGFRSFVFYNERLGKNIQEVLELAKAGFLKDFELYWNFDVNNRLLPPPVPYTGKWIENNRVTRYNSKGLELETKDAMGIYTAAQYGYSKTMPVAIANNARYDEIANDNFEDNSYSDRISGKNISTCPKDHAGFRGMPNSQVVDASTAGFSAHTGKYMLSVNANSTAPREFAVKALPVDSFNIDGYRVDTTSNLYELGGNLDYVSKYPYYIFNAPIEPSFNMLNSAGMAVSFYPHDTSIYVGGSTYFHEHKYTMNMSQYVEIVTSGNYSFHLAATADGSPTPERSFVEITIAGVDNGVGKHYSAGYATGPINYSGTVMLCKGIYRIGYSIGNEYQADLNFPEALGYFDDFSISTTFPEGYKSLNKQDGCTFTVPFEARDSMFNPVFSAPSGEKMLFSAWVRQGCTTPCMLTSYDDNKVQIQFDAGTPLITDLKPSGPIIEGWQRYEGVFTVPAGATKMTTKFVNTGSTPVYFDDIRIHPFNANMKSYVYDPVNLRLLSELDANNYASFYEYDAEGTLIRTKAETREGVKTITESRSTKQKNITSFQ